MVRKFHFIIECSPVKDLTAEENLISVCPLPSTFLNPSGFWFLLCYSNVTVTCGLYTTKEEYIYKGVKFCFLLFYLDGCLVKRTHSSILMLSPFL